MYDLREKSCIGIWSWSKCLKRRAQLTFFSPQTEWFLRFNRFCFLFLLFAVASWMLLCQTVRWCFIFGFFRCVLAVDMFQQTLKKKCKLELVRLLFWHKALIPFKSFWNAFGRVCGFHFETCSSPCIFIEYIIENLFFMKPGNNRAARRQCERPWETSSSTDGRVVSSSSFLAVRQIVALQASEVWKN